MFTVLTHFWACNDGGPWWRKREIVTDVVYWFFAPTFARVFRIGLLVVGAAAIFNIHDADDLIAFYENGHGPLAQLPEWAQALVFLVAADFMLYWLHRMFHGTGFWKYHAVHHSSKELDWISAARFHPVNLLIGTIGVDVVLLMAGISPNAMVLLAPFNTFHSAFVHANLNWTLGPVQICAGDAGVPPLASHPARRGRKHQFRRYFPALGHPVRHLPDARERNAEGVRQGRSGDAGRLCRADGFSLPPLGIRSIEVPPAFAVHSSIVITLAPSAG